jgi:1,4-alpha-glucan branching enzyme
LIFFSLETLKFPLHHTDCLYSDSWSLQADAIDLTEKDLEQIPEWRPLAKTPTAGGRSPSSYQIYPPSFQDSNGDG